MQTQGCDGNLRYLQAEFARIDLLIRREVRRWVLAGQDPNDDYRGLYVTQTEVETILAHPPGAHWGDTIGLPPEEEEAFAEAATQTIQHAQSIKQAMLQQGKTPRLCQLVQAFQLDQLALDIFLICLAPAFDTRYERLFGFLQDNVTLRRPTVRLMLTLLGQPGIQQFELAAYFSTESPLLQYELIERVVEATPAPPHWINQTLHASEAVVTWLLGLYVPHAILGGNAVLQLPQADQTDRVLTSETWRQLAALTGNRTTDRQAEERLPVIALWGPDEISQQALARRLAWHRQVALLTVDISKVINENCSPRKAVRLALRDARLTGALPYLRGWDACLIEDELAAPDVLSQVCAYPGVVIVAGRKPWQANGLDRRRRIDMLEFPIPGYQQRIAVWSHLLAQAVERKPAPPVAQIFDLTGLAAQFALSSAQIGDAVAAARDKADLEGRAIDNADLYQMARSFSNPRLNLLARKITPRYTWDDIILPVDQVAILHELVATIRGRPQVLEQWGVGQKLASSAGVTVLFAGPPGTGKTMAAEVIAHTLGLDLYKIDLSTVVSKYIGETEKNLERIFQEASSSNSILFFDEADAIFGKRSEVKDAHDRYANIEVSYLLQRMEAYDGVTMLATNLRANLDDAFARRLQFAVDFPFPGSAERLHIWQTLFPPDVPRAANLDFALLARRFELAGGNIRNIIVSAAYLAANDGGQVTMTHLMHGARRELQKMGRLVGQEEFQIKP